MIRKVFKYRLDTKKNILIKEDLQRTRRGDTFKINMTVGLSDDFSLVEPQVKKSGVAIQLSEAISCLSGNPEAKAELERKVREGVIPTFINLGLITYMVNVTLQYKGDELEKETITTFIPIAYKDSSNMVCMAIDETLTDEAKQDILLKVKEYVLTRLD